MGQARVTAEQKREALAAFQAAGGSQREAARTLNLPYTTFRNRLERAREEIEAEESAEDIELPVLPDGDIGAGEIIDLMCRRFSKRHELAKARKWAEIRLPDESPVGIGIVGDPHVDSNGCNWPLLRRDCELLRSEGCYAINIGDTTDNWVGRLTRLYAESETSKETAWKLAEWLLAHSGVRWLAWVLGNHDAWNDGAAVLSQMLQRRPERVLLEDWGAQLNLVTPAGRGFRFWLSHDFRGHSQYNALHGAKKSAMWGEEADVYACGHKHTWALTHEENAQRGHTYWLARARGYKWLDSHADHLGYASQQAGATILAVLDPADDGPDRVICFADLERGVEYLRWLRDRRAQSG